VEWRFGNSALEQLYTKGVGQRLYPQEIVRAFLKRVNDIRSAPSERDLRAMKSLHYEQLKGDRQGQISLRLNKQWRLILTVERSRTGRKTIVIHEISKHYN